MWGFPDKIPIVLSRSLSNFLAGVTMRKIIKRYKSEIVIKTIVQELKTFVTRKRFLSTLITPAKKAAMFGFL